jgi:prepilin-type N-terminal cleavage/methylation domain-containing protein
MPSVHAERTERRRGFTVIELITAMALLSVLLIMLASITDSAGKAWAQGRSRVDTFQSARSALEIMGRELTPAIVDTRMQFVHLPGEVLSETGAENVAPNSPALLWMAPLGDNGQLRCNGYYLYRDEARRFFRLKRITVAESAKVDPRSVYFPRMINLANPRDPMLRTSPVNAEWFTRSWDRAAFDEEDASNEAAIVSTVADGVVAFWARCVDVLGEPVPLLSEARNHPKSRLFYNSAAFMQMATSKPFDNGSSTIYLAETPESLKSNRVPAAVDLTVITLDSVTLDRISSLPVQNTALDKHGAVDLETSVRAYESALRENNIFTARTFNTRVKLVNGK